jgi:hypothetical protein
MGTPGTTVIDRIVNEQDYPLADPEGAAWRHVVVRARRDLAATGSCVLPGFLDAAAQDALGPQCASIATHAYFDVETVNVYNQPPDPSWPADHPGRIPMQRGNAFVPADLIPPGFVIAQLYRSELFQRFVAGCFGLSRLYPLADPLACLCVNVIRPGHEHPWHFDTNEFTVSMVTQQPQAGGVFEYCPNLRSADTENFADVRDVLTGRGERLIHRLPLRPGDLQLFRGRYSLHRVTRVEASTRGEAGTVEGGMDRHSAIFAYCEHPGVVGTVARTRQLFGRVLPEHLAAADRSGRGDQLLD